MMMMNQDRHSVSGLGSMRQQNSTDDFTSLIKKHHDSQNTQDCCRRHIMFKSLNLNLIIIGLLQQLSAHDIPVLRGAKSLSDVKVISNSASHPNPEINKILNLVSNNLPDPSVKDDI
jgi:hypothetical protein